MTNLPFLRQILTSKNESEPTCSFSTVKLRYVDDIFVLFESSESADSLREYMSSKHQNINFIVEKENVGSLSFLDIKICRKNGKFVTSVYRKPTFSGFSPIMKVSFQRTKREDFYTHYFIGVLAYVVISKHFILKLTI